MILGRTVIPTDKFEETISFYQTILDAHFAIGKVKAIAKVENFLLSIVKNDADYVLFPTGNGIYLDFLVSDLPSLQSRMQESIVVKEWEELGETFILTKDPNGNLVLFHGYISHLSAEKDAFQLLGIKVSFLASFLNSFYAAISNLIRTLRKHGFRDDIIQEIVQMTLPLDELFSSRKAYLSKVPQTPEEKEDFDLYYRKSSQLLRLMADDLEKMLDTVSKNSLSLDNTEIQKAIGRARDVLDDCRDLVELGNEKQ